MDRSKDLNIIAENVVTFIDSKFKNDNVPQEVLNYLYLAVTGLSMSLGLEYVDDIFSLLDKVTFINNTDINNLDNYSVIPRISEDTSIKYQLYIKDISNGNYSTLEFIIKEFINILCINNTNIDINSTLVFNVIKVLTIEDSINNILYIKNYYIYNSKFKKALDSFEDILNNWYYANGYENIVNLFRPLFKFNYIKKLLIIDLINGNYQDIYDEFDRVLGENSFINMLNSLRNINRDLGKKNVPTYNVACTYLNIRNKFVQNYISLKFAH